MHDYFSSSGKFFPDYSEDEVNNFFYSSASSELAYIVGNVVHFMTKFYKSKFPNHFFKNIHKNTKVPLREYKNKTILDLLKKKKPILSVNADIDFRKNGFLSSNYHTRQMPYDSRNINSIDKFTVPLFNDPTRNIKLNFSMTNVDVKITMTSIYTTRIQQYNSLWSIDKMFSFEPMSITERIKFPIKEDYIYYIGKLIGHVDDDYKVIDPIAFTSALNKLSEFPIYYEKDTATGNYRYFCMIPTKYELSIQTPNFDQGEKRNDISDNFKIDHEITVTVNVPSVFYLIVKKEKFTIDHLLEQYGPTTDGADELQEIGNIEYDWLPLITDEEFMIQGYSGYEFDEDGSSAEINIMEIMFERLYQAIGKAEEKNIDLSEFVEVVVYEDRERMDDQKWRFDYSTNILYIDSGSIETNYTIVIYANNEVINMIINNNLIETVE